MTRKQKKAPFGVLFLFFLRSIDVIDPVFFAGGGGGIIPFHIAQHAVANAFVVAGDSQGF